MRYIVLAIMILLTIVFVRYNVQEPIIEPTIHCTIELQAQGICG